MKKKIGHALYELILLLLTLIILMPIFYFAISAFKLREDIVYHPLQMTAEMFTLDNFKVAYSKMKLFKAMSNTVFITVGSMIITVIFSAMAGFVMARVKARRFTVAYSFMVALMVVPFIGCVIPLVVIMNRIGLYNNLWSCLLIQAGWNLPFATFLYTGFMKSLPKELEEAAMIDGCGMFGTFTRIFLPLQAPVTATCCIRNGIGVWNDYLVSASFLNSSKTPTLMVSVKKFFGQYVNEYGQSFAAVVMCSIPIILIFLFLQKYFVKGIAAGAVKG